MDLVPLEKVENLDNEMIIAVGVKGYVVYCSSNLYDVAYCYSNLNHFILLCLHD